MTARTRWPVVISCVLYSGAAIVACAVWLRYADLTEMSLVDKAQRVADFHGMACEVRDARNVEEGWIEAQCADGSTLSMILPLQCGADGVLCDWLELDASCWEIERR